MAHTLVPSDHVETASVYGRGDEKIGTIERLMLEKNSGTVAYAVVRCGGLLKGEVHHYPVPWDTLKYDVARKVYTMNLTLEELRSGHHRNSTARLSTGATAPRSIAIRSIGRCRAANLPRVYPPRRQETGRGGQIRGIGRARPSGLWTILQVMSYKQQCRQHRRGNYPICEVGVLGRWLIRFSPVWHCHLHLLPQGISEPKVGTVPKSPSY